MRKNMYKQRRAAVLFDLDGVIASSEVQKSEAHIQTVLKLGGVASLALSELYSEIIGLSHEETRDKFLECAGVTATPEVKQVYRGIYKSFYQSKLKDVKLAPGAKQLLRVLSSQRYRIGLVSSAHPEEVAAILKRKQIESLFTVIVSSDLVKNHKPSPEPYLKALELLGLEQTPNLAVAFEDTCAGIAAARGAKLKVFAVRHRLNRKQNLDKAEKVFDSLADDQIIHIIENYLGSQETSESTVC